MEMGFEDRELRDAFGRFTTGICLITTVTESGESVALTANSFSSLSLDPPLVLWSLQENSDAYDRYAAARLFAINVLALEQRELSVRYARRGHHRLAAEHYLAGELGCPVIRGALAAFECELETTIPGGDHLIIVGRVRGIQCRADGEPLLFYGGAYRALQ
jgi:flavin reductase (DIM6/NTAB) family NADH-FMN oxidoreductase RutF